MLDWCHQHFSYYAFNNGKGPRFWKSCHLTMLTVKFYNIVPSSEESIALCIKATSQNGIDCPIILTALFNQETWMRGSSHTASAQTQTFSYAATPLVKRVLISPIIRTGLPSNMEERVLSHSFLSSRVFARAVSCD